jgi:hypothetical protein
MRSTGAWPGMLDALWRLYVARCTLRHVVHRTLVYVALYTAVRVLRAVPLVQVFAFGFDHGTYPRGNCITKSCALACRAAAMTCAAEAWGACRAPEAGALHAVHDGLALHCARPARTDGGMGRVPAGRPSDMTVV